MSNPSVKIHPVIMAGGSGTRFWPLSRRARPKQFLPLVSEDPLLVDTLARLPPLASSDDTFVVCGPSHADQVRELLPTVPGAQVLVEPQARNTAPAIGLAALHVAHRDPKGILAVLPSDHHIGNPTRFREVLAEAATVASEGFLVTIGIQPTHPETGYGYVQLGGALDGLGEARRVQRFVEKPDLTRAKEYLADGGYVWNAGIFVLRADVILSQIDKHLPGLSRALAAIRPAIGTAGYDAVLEANFGLSEATSIDYGVMERASEIACVPGDFGWSDVGSFAALPDVREADASGNVTEGNALLVDSEGCVVVGAEGSERLVAAVGVRDLVIVDSGDVLLVLPRDKAQDVRKIVDALQKRGDHGLL